jgi:tight adherence protein B
MALLVAIITFATALVLVFAIWLLVGGGSEEDIVRRRLDAVRMAEQRGTDAQDLHIVRDEMLSFLGLAVAACPLGVVAYIRRRRLRSFEEHFPEALDLLGRAVRAGHAFTTGLELIATETTAPISTEFRITFEEQNLGLPLRDSLLNLTERVPLVDVRLFVTALLIQKETGGNLAEIMDELARVIRERFQIYREVNIKTAQGRLTAMILILMPLIMMAVLGAVNPQYIGVLFSDPIGRLMLMGAAGLQLFGSLILWRVVHIEV